MKLHAIYGTTYKDLEKENKHLNLQLDQALKDYEELLVKIDKAIEYITSNLIQNDITRQDYEEKIKELLEILGDKEND